MKTRTVSLEAEIDSDEARAFSRKIHILLRESTDAPIHIIINSQGGDLLAAQAIYDTIKDTGVSTTCEAKGSCMSAATVIVQACDYRWVHPNCAVMVHQSEHELGGTKGTLIGWSKYAATFDKFMCKLYAERSIKDASFWQRKINKGDYIMSADEAVKYGLFDAVVGRDDGL